MFIIAVLVAVFTVGYAFAWFFDKKGVNFELTGASAGAYFDVTSGNGTSEDEAFIISNATHMRNLAVLQNTGRFGNNKYYFRIKDDVTVLNMGSLWLPPIGNDDNPFIGDFNGNGKTIANLKVTTDKALLTETSYPTQAAPSYAFSQSVGLFGTTGSDSFIHNFILDKPHVVVGAVGVHNNLYKEGSAKVVGIAVGHVAGLCQSIGVRATDDGANTADGVGSTTLDVRVIGYTTFNSILGELGDGVESSVTGGGHVPGEGAGGSGNAFGASFDVQTYALRLFAMEENHTLDTPSYYLPIGARGSNDYPVLRSGERMPFTVSNAINSENYKTIYKDMGSKAMETIAENNIGYVLGNQTKLNEKTLTFAEAMTQSGDANGTWTYSHEPDRGHVPMWFYTRDKSKYDSESYGYDKNTTGVEAITIEQYKSLPAGIKNLLPTGADKYMAEDASQPNNVTNPNIGTQKSYFTIRLSANLTYESIRNNGNTNNNDWSYHGQISWMGKTYGKGFSDKDGYAVDENGNYYSSTGNLLGADGYDRDADGHYGADVSKFANFPYIVYSYDLVSNTAYAKDENGNRYYAYKRDNGEYVYGILSGGYLMTGDGFNSYAAPMVGWTQPILLIDADGYAMYAPGVYYDVSGNTLVGGYIIDSNGYYIPVDTGFVLPIANAYNGYAQDADGNYYGAITLNGQTVYCYLGANGKTSGYTGYYQIDGNNFLVAATNVDADGYVKYDATDYYGTYDGISGYVDANGYFYTLEGSQKVYVSTDAGFNEVINNISSSGYAMTADGRYYGKGTLNNDAVYGLLDVSNNGKKYLQVDGKYLATDGNSYDAYDVDDDGRIMYNDELYYATLNSAATGWQNAMVMVNSDGYVYDVSLDAHGNTKGYYLDASSWVFNGGYEICTHADSQYYGYFVKHSVDSDGNIIEEPYKDAQHENALVKAWGYTAEELKNIYVGYAGNIAVKTSTFLKAVEGGEYISVAEGTKNRAISSADINGIEGEFIALQEGEKFAVVKNSDTLDSVTVGEGKKVKFNAFIGGIALPNNAIWFKPSQAGTLKFVMFADSEANGFALMRIYRGTEKRDPASDDFFGVVNYDTDMGFSWERLIMQKLPKGVLFYYEFEISQDEIDMGNIEYILCMQGNGGAHFLYLDIGSSASEEVVDSSGVVPDTISAVDFIYDGVEIEQTDETIGIGNFIVSVSGVKKLYNSSKTSVYFEDIKAVLKVVYVRLNEETGKHSGKTICLEYTPDGNLEEVYATYTTYVCPEIKGGSGTVGSGGGGQVNPNPGPDTPDAPTLTVTNTSLSMTAGGATQKINATASSGATITYSSNKPDIASVASDGTVTANAAGTATITVTATADGKTTTKTVNVTVTAAQITDTAGTYTYSISDYKSSVSGKATDSSISVTGLSGSVTEGNVSENPNDYKFTPGYTITITLNAQAGQNVSVKLTGYSGSTGNDVGINVDMTNATMNSSSKEIVFSAATSNSNRGEGTVQYTATSDGEIVITLTRSKNNTTRVTDIEVVIGGNSEGGDDPAPTPTVSSVSVTPTTASVEAGKTTTLNASVTMSDGSDYSGSTVWTSSDTSVATVINGVVTGVKAGTAKITASAGGVTSDEVTITVTAATVSGTIYPANGTYSVVDGNLSKSLTLATDGIEFSNNNYDTSSNATWSGSINGASAEFGTCMRAAGGGRYIAINVQAGTKISVAFGGSYGSNNAAGSMWIGSTSSTEQKDALASKETTNVGKTANGLLEYTVTSDGTYYIFFDNSKPIIFAIVLS